MTTSHHVSRVFHEDGQTFLAAAPGHAISVDWLLANTPDLWRQWLAAPDTTTRNQLASRIDATFTRFEEPPPSTAPTRRGAIHTCAAVRAVEAEQSHRTTRPRTIGVRR